MELKFKELDEKIKIKIEAIGKSYERSVELINERFSIEFQANGLTEYRQQMKYVIDAKKNDQINELNKLCHSMRDVKLTRRIRYELEKKINSKNDLIYFRITKKIDLFDVVAKTKIRLERNFDLFKLNKYSPLMIDRLHNSIFINSILCNNRNINGLFEILKKHRDDYKNYAHHSINIKGREIKCVVNESLDFHKLSLDDKYLIVINLESGNSDFFYKNPYKMYVVNRQGIELYQKVCAKEYANGILKVSSNYIVRIVQSLNNENKLEVYNSKLEMIDSKNILKNFNNGFFINNNEIAIKDNSIIVYKIENQKISLIYDSNKAFNDCLNGDNRLFYFDSRNFYLFNKRNSDKPNLISIVSRNESQTLVNFQIKPDLNSQAILFDKVYSQIISFNLPSKSYPKTIIGVFDLNGKLLFEFRPEMYINDLDFDETGSLIFNKKIILSDRNIDFKEF